MRSGIVPKNVPPLTINSIPPALKHFIAKILVIKAIIKTMLTLITGLILSDENGIAMIPEKNTIAIVLNKKPINALPS